MNAKTGIIGFGIDGREILKSYGDGGSDRWKRWGCPAKYVLWLLISRKSTTPDFLFSAPLSMQYR